MTERDQLVLKALLKILSEMDQSDETVLFHAVGQLVSGLLWGEMITALRYAEKNKWIIGVKGKLFQNNKWSMSDEGRAAALES